MLAGISKGQSKPWGQSLGLNQIRERRAMFICPTAPFGTAWIVIVAVMEAKRGSATNLTVATGTRSAAQALNSRQRRTE